MFVHWGPVSLRGTEIGWSRGQQVPAEEYDNLYREFNPTLFSAKEWIKAAKDAGMEYFVITSKHHDGFSLWDTKQSEYDIMSTPFGRDVLRELADECKKQGIWFCTYYSIIDWYHPDYIPRGKGDDRPPAEANFERYISFMKKQLDEIVTHYKPGMMWFDGYWENTWTHEEGMKLYAYVKNLDSSILINNRVDKGRDKTGMMPSYKFAGDFGTPEQKIGNFNRQQPWETCMTICKQWAWKPNDEFKSLEECIHTLVRTVGGDGNLLLNVGPMLDGRIEQRQINRLRKIGVWLKEHGESIYRTRGGPYMPNEWLASTCKENKIYLHILKMPENSITLPPLKGRKIINSSVLNGSKVKVIQTEDKITISLPGELIDEINTVIVLELNGTSPDIDPIAVK